MQNEETTVHLITETKHAAIKRLNDEFEISKKIIIESNKPDNEIEILEGWKKWYLGVFDSYIDLEPGGAGTKTQQAIKEARSEIISHSDKLTKLISN